MSITSLAGKETLSHRLLVERLGEIVSMLEKKKKKQYSTTELIDIAREGHDRLELDTTVTVLATPCVSG